MAMNKEVAAACPDCNSRNLGCYNSAAQLMVCNDCAQIIDTELSKIRKVIRLESALSASAEPVDAPVSGCVHHDFSALDRYIRDIRWSGDTPADIRNAVTSNLRGLYGHLLCRGMFAGAGSWDAGRMAAAKWVENRRCAYGDKHGETDPTTGVLEFGNGYPERDEYYSELAEIEEAIRVLPAPQFVAHAPPASCNPTTQPAIVPDEVLEVAARLIREAVPATASGQTCFVPKYVIDQLSAAISSYSTPETLT